MGALIAPISPYPKYTTPRMINRGRPHAYTPFLPRYSSTACAGIKALVPLVDVRTHWLLTKTVMQHDCKPDGVGQVDRWTFLGRSPAVTELKSKDPLRIL